MQTFGRYEVLDLIGQGGMGAVYKAYDPLMRRDVALKLLRTDAVSEPGYQERFRREALMAAGLTEPHVLTILDFGDQDGQLFIVMPLIEGQDVDRLLKMHGPMPPQRAVQVVEHIAEALTAAHAKNLVHRDVKPSNALVAENGFVYLIDFGIARDTAAPSMTQTGHVFGSLAYMAPERMDGISDPPVDVYSLACLLYECLTGAQPFPGGTLEQMKAHAYAPPPRPSVGNPSVPQAFDDVIQRGMAKDPARRYQSAQQLASAAREALVERSPTPETTHTAIGRDDEAQTRPFDPGRQRTQIAPRRDAAGPTRDEGIRPPALLLAGGLMAMAGITGAISSLGKREWAYRIPPSWVPMAALACWVLLAGAFLVLANGAPRGHGPSLSRGVPYLIAGVAVLLAFMEVRKYF